ncbi:MAG: PhoH family protein [Holophagales bacterium]|jgi:PhoH-like ATPase|nr:PhoH family protein [Holophagales bacterium]
MVASSKKVFVLDTNVLLHDPQAIFRFQEHDLVIPIVVIEEIDTFKKDQTEVGRNARTVSRNLDALRKKGSLSKGVQLDDGGTLTVDVSNHALDDTFAHINQNPADNMILACAKSLLDKRRENVVLVSKDTNMRIKADALGFRTDDYTTGRVELDELYSGAAEILVEEGNFDQLFQEGLPPPDDEEFFHNQCITLIDKANDSHTALGRFNAVDKRIHPLRAQDLAPWGIRPRNREQQFALELLFDESINVVTLLGRAGTGKTLLAIAAGLQQIVDDEKYNKLLVSRPVMPMGKDIGFLPGDVEDKLRPYMQPIYDNLDFIVAANTEMRRRSSMTISQLEEGGYLSVEPLTYIRGRSIPNQYIIVDEAQNLTPHEVRTILTRAGNGAKVVLTGDPYQIDNPYVDGSTNGLSFLAEHFKGQELSGHIILIKGERSKLAELASKLL